VQPERLAQLTDKLLVVVTVLATPAMIKVSYVDQAMILG
jgi:predicted thioesterase